MPEPWITPGEITREECPNGHRTHPEWAICAECGALLVEVRYVPADSRPAFDEERA